MKSEVVKAIAKSMAHLAADPLLTGEICSCIRCPVLLCVGEGDTTAVPEDTRIFSQRLRTADVVVLPGTRHPFEEVDLDVLVPLLQAFWAKAPQRPITT